MPLTDNYREAQLAARAVEGKMRAEAARNVQAAIQRYVATIETKIKQLSPGASQAARRRFLKASQSVFTNAANRLEDTIVRVTAEGRSVMFIESQAIMAEAADRAADLVGVDKAALGAVKVPPVSMLGAYENLGATVSWRTLVNGHIQGVKDEVNFIVREAILDGADPRALARGLRQYVTGDASLRAAFSKKGFDWRKARANPATRGAAKRADYNARRIATSEIHNSRREAEAQHFAADPFVRAVKWTLAPDRGSANVPDECDVLAAIDAYDLGPGIYPVTNVPGSPHPFDRCEIEPVTTDDPVLAGQPKASPPFNRGALARMPIPNLPKGRKLSKLRAQRIREHAGDAIGIGNRAEIQSILDDLAKAAESAFAKAAPTAATLDKAAKALALRNEGFTYEQIGQALGTNDSNAFRLVKIAKKQGLTPPPTTTILPPTVVPPVIPPLPTPPVAPVPPVIPGAHVSIESFSAEQVFGVRKFASLHGVEEAKAAFGLSSAEYNAVNKAAEALLDAGAFEFHTLTIAKTATDAKFVLQKVRLGQSLDSIASEMQLGVARVRELKKVATELIKEGKFRGTSHAGGGFVKPVAAPKPQPVITAMPAPDTQIEFIRPTKVQAEAAGIKHVPSAQSVRNAQHVHRRIAGGATDEKIAQELGLGVARVRELKRLGKQLKSGGFTKGGAGPTPTPPLPKGLAQFTDDELKFLTTEELGHPASARAHLVQRRKFAVEKPGLEAQKTLKTDGRHINFTPDDPSGLSTLGNVYGKNSFGTSTYDGYADLMRATDKLAKPKAINSGPGTSSYNPHSNVLKMASTFDAPTVNAVTSRAAFTYRHEYGHHIDSMLGKFFGKTQGISEKLSKLKKAWNAEKAHLAGEADAFKRFEDLLRHYKANMPPAGRDYLKSLAQDITHDFGAVPHTQSGAKALGGGHSQAYLAKAGNPESEFFANWYSIMSAPDEAVIYLRQGLTHDLRIELRTRFPKYAEAFDDAISQVVQSGTKPPTLAGVQIPADLTPAQKVAHLNSLPFKKRGWETGHKRARAAQASTRGKFSIPERDGIRGYVNSEYVPINRKLRIGDGIADAEIKAIDRVIARCELEEDMLVYRGGRAPVQGNLQAGKTYIDKGFVSTSAKETVASNYAQKSSHRLVVEIRLRKGQHGYVVSKNNYSEWEVVLPRNLEYIIVEVKTSRHIVVEIIG